MKSFTSRINRLCVAVLVTFPMFPSAGWSQSPELLMSHSNPSEGNMWVLRPEADGPFSKVCTPYFKELRAQGANLKLQNEMDDQTKRDEKAHTGIAIGLGTGVAAVLTLTATALVAPVAAPIVAGAGLILAFVPIVAIPYFNNVSGDSSEKIQCLKYAVKSGMNLNVDTPTYAGIATNQTKAMRTEVVKASTESSSDQQTGTGAKAL